MGLDLVISNWLELAIFNDNQIGISHVDFLEYMGVGGRQSSFSVVSVD